MQLWYANRGQNITLPAASRFVSVVRRPAMETSPKFLGARSYAATLWIDLYKIIHS